MLNPANNIRPLMHIIPKKPGEYIIVVYKHIGILLGPQYAYTASAIHRVSVVQ